MKMKIFAILGMSLLLMGCWWDDPHIKKDEDVPPVHRKRAEKEDLLDKLRSCIEKSQYTECIQKGEGQLDKLSGEAREEACLLIGEAYERSGLYGQKNIQTRLLNRARDYYKRIPPSSRFYPSSTQNLGRIATRILEEAQKASRNKESEQALAHIEQLDLYSDFLESSYKKKAIYCYYKNTARALADKFRPVIQKAKIQSLGLLSFANFEGQTSREARLLKETLQRELSFIPKISSPALSAKETAQLFQRDSHLLKTLASKYHLTHFLYAVCDQMTTLYLIDKGGTNLASELISSLPYRLEEGAKPAPTISEDQQSFQLDTAFITKRDGRWIKIQEGGTLYTNEEFYILARSSKRVYFYIVLEDSQGKIDVLFPRAGFHLPPRIQRQKLYFIPPLSPANSNSPVFYLYGKRGVEFFILAASAEKWVEIEQLKGEVDPTKRREILRKIKSHLPAITRGVGIRMRRETLTLERGRLPSLRIPIAFDTMKVYKRGVRFFKIIHK